MERKKHASAWEHPLLWERWPDTREARFSPCLPGDTSRAGTQFPPPCSPLQTSGQLLSSGTSLHSMNCKCSKGMSTGKERRISFGSLSHSHYWKLLPHFLCTLWSTLTPLEKPTLIFIMLSATPTVVQQLAQSAPPRWEDKQAQSTSTECAYVLGTYVFHLSIMLWSDFYKLV